MGVGTYGGLFAVLGGLAPVMITFMGETLACSLQFALVMTGHLIGAIVTGHLVRRYGIKGNVSRGLYKRHRWRDVFGICVGRYCDPSLHSYSGDHFSNRFARPSPP